MFNLKHSAVKFKYEVIYYLIRTFKWCLLKKILKFKKGIIMKKCPFSSEQKGINEQRCIIPSELRNKHLEKYCSTGFETWFCEYHNKEEECPIYKIVKRFTIDYHNTKITESNKNEYDKLKDVVI